MVVADTEEFVTRIKQAAVEKGYKHFRILVKYVGFSHYQQYCPATQPEAQAHWKL